MRKFLRLRQFFLNVLLGNSLSNEVLNLNTYPSSPAKFEDLFLAKSLWMAPPSEMPINIGDSRKRRRCIGYTSSDEVRFCEQDDDHTDLIGIM